MPAAENRRDRGGGGGGSGIAAGYSKALVWLGCIVAVFAVAVPVLISPYGEVAAVCTMRCVMMPESLVVVNFVPGTWYIHSFGCSVRSGELSTSSERQREAPAVIFRLIHRKSSTTVDA